MASVRSCKKLVLCSIKPMPAGSKNDPLLAKAKPISNSSSTSAITSLREESCCTTATAAERGVRLCERNSSAGTKVSAEGGGGGAPGTRAEIPLQPLMKTMVRQAVTLQPTEVNSGADMHLQPMEDPTPEQVNAPKEGCDPMGSPCWNRFLAGPVDPRREEPMPEQVCWQGL